MSSALAFLSLAAWFYLILFRGGFWRTDQRLEASPAPPTAWPAVAAVVPARNEAAVIGRTLGALLAQDYPGAFHVIVVDDESADGTAGLACDTARSAGLEERLNVVAGTPTPEGWTGKTWALAQGVERAREALPDARYLWFSDADIVHQPETLHRLVCKAEAGRLDLVSLMALLDCGGAWARLLIPAFVFFFQKLYPFAWVGRQRRRTAGAAGGCMLLRRAALEAAGGLHAISGALIDDCALAAAIKRNGPIWLGLATTTRSLRPYRGLGAVWEMVARSAFTQLRHSTPLLALTVAGMLVVYLVPPVAALGGPIAGADAAAAAGLAAWLIMAAAYRPTLKLYRQPAAAAVLLPVAALLYTAMTVDSALRHWRGAGGRWKGRITAARLR